MHGKVMMLVVKDVHTGFLGAYASDTKHSDAVREDLDHYLGNARVRTVYSDNARDLVKAVQAMGLGGHHEFSQPGMPQTNAIAERAVQEVLHGTRTLLVQAGLPGYVWSYAAPCFCLIRNTRFFLVAMLWTRRVPIPE